MLNVQKWLHEQKGDFSKLTEQLGIRCTFNEYDNRVILNYNQIDSPKTNEIVMECRALTLDKTDYSLVARSFNRFFNCGEALAITKRFRFDMPFYAHDKEDGSLIKVYYYNDEWQVETRGTFGQGKPQDLSPYTWEELVWQTLPSNFRGMAQKGTTYVFELCTNWNKVVRNYHTPSIFMLTQFCGMQEIESDIVHIDADILGIDVPTTHNFKDLMDAQYHLTEIAEYDPTYEGVVLRDCDNLRLKVKNPKWFALARLKEGAVSVKNIVPLVLSGEYEEAEVYFPELKPEFDRIAEQIEKIKLEIDKYWFAYGEEKSRKKFALSVKECKYSGPLFQAWINNGHPFDYLTQENFIKWLS